MRISRASAAVMILACALVAATDANARRRKTNNRVEEQSFESASRLYLESTRDRSAAISAFERFLREFRHSPRAADAQFMIGEAYFDDALKILRKEAEAKKRSSSRFLAPRNVAAINSLKRARDSFARVIKGYRRDKTKSGLRCSAQYRLGEVAYNGKDWGAAIEEWRTVEEDFPKCYLVPESWMGIIFANLALEQFSQAEANLFLLGETYPHYLKVPKVLYVQGIISLHKGDYANAERAFKRVDSAEAQFYLGKTFLLSKRPYLAAATFERLVRRFPRSVLREETEFFIGDSFFLAKDFDGAITKYSRFQGKYPDSQLRVSALFRIGSAHFQKRNYIEARAHFQSVIDRYPRDFFSPLAQYFIAESYLVEKQYREALFAYTKVITQYPETIKISPLAHYKLAWSQYQVGDFSQSGQSCRNFLSRYPTHSLAKNVYLLLGNSLLAQRRYDQAVTAFQRIIDLAPTSNAAEQALFSILQTQYQLKSFNSILTSYQFIFRHLPPSQSKWRPLSYIYASEAYLSLNRVEEAKAIYEMILKVYPNDTAAFYAQDGLAWSYAFLGDDARSLTERKKLSDMLKLARSTYTFSGTNQLGIADSMYNRKEYEDAFQLYDKFASENPKHARVPQALYRAGMSLYHLRYYTQAIEQWRKLTEDHPQAPESVKAVFQIADTLFRAQKYRQAVAAYQDIIRTYPKSPQLPLAYLRVAMSSYNKKDAAGTLNGALSLLTKFPEAPEAVDALDLMEAVYDRNKKADFRKSLRTVVESVPGTETAAEAQFRIGRRLFEMGIYAEAAVELQKFSVDYTSSKKLKQAQFLLAESLFKSNKHRDAVFAFERFLVNFPRNENTPVVLFHLASAHYSQKDHDPAIKNYVQLLDRYPDSEYAQAAQFNLALAFKAVGNLERAEEAYARFAAMKGADSESGRAALWELFQIQKDRKNYAGAMNTLTQIFDAGVAGADLIEATYHQGDVYSMMGRPDEALRTWAGLLGLTPRKSAYRLQGLIRLGELYEAREDWSKAVRVYTDLGRNAKTNVAAAAKERAAGLRKKAGGGAAPAAKKKSRARPTRKSKKKAKRNISIPDTN